MWKKDEQTPATAAEDEAPPRSRSSPPSSSPPGERATIGPSITVKGEVSGDEDLFIQGRVEGSVDLTQHAVTVGREGRVNANITARVVTVEGEVEGDLEAQEQIILRASARVKGDITAPRVALEDGASFRGLVDMGEPSRKEAPRSGSATRSGSGSGGGSAAAAVKGGSGSSSRSPVSSASGSAATTGSEGS